MQYTTRANSVQPLAYAVFSRTSGDFVAFMGASPQAAADYYGTDYQWVALTINQQRHLVTLTDGDGVINATAKHSRLGRARIYSY